MSVTTLHGQPTLNISAPGKMALSRLDPVRKIFDKFFSSIPQIVRGHVVAVIGEFLGTCSFLFFAFSAAEVAFVSGNDNKGDKVDYTTKSLSTIQLLYIAFGVGISLVVNAWTFFRISGALFDPAVSIAMFLIGGISFTRCVLLCIAQCAGAIAASALAYAVYSGGLHVGTALKPGVSVAQGAMIEVILTCQLVFTVLMLAAEKHEATFLAPLGIGLAVFNGEIAGFLWTGGSMNPARSLGPAVITREFPSEHWIYWVGPISGGILASLIYKLIKALEYETAQLDPSELEPEKVEDTEKGHTGPCECMCFRTQKQNLGQDTLQIPTDYRKSSSLVPVKSVAQNSSMRSRTSGESSSKPKAEETGGGGGDDFMKEMISD